MANRFFIPTTRIEAFSDGVFAIVMTLLAFQFKVPKYSAAAGLNQNFRALLQVAPNFISFVFSFLFVAVFWVNHHQLFHSIKEADRKLLWLNIHLLFWITMIPFPTGMVGDYPQVSLAAISLAIVLLMVSVSSYLVRRYSYYQAALTNENKSARIIKEGLSKNIVAIVLNLAAIATTFISVDISYIIFLVVLILFSIPHRSEIKNESSTKKIIS
jgi:uncharacterized membrane protein